MKNSWQACSSNMRVLFYLFTATLSAPASAQVNELNIFKDIVASISGFAREILLGPADLASRIKMQIFLQDVRSRMVALARAKQAVLYTIDEADCAQSEISERARVVTEIKVLLGDLDEQIKELDRIGWTGRGSSLVRLGDSLNELSLARGKGWVLEINRFCSYSQSEQDRMRRDVQETVKLAQRSVDEIDQLIAKFSLSMDG
jgi:hypothetical protein